MTEASAPSPAALARRHRQLRRAGQALILTGIQFAAVAILQTADVIGSLLALAAVYTLIGVTALRGNRAALVPGLAISALIVGLAIWRAPLLAEVAGPWLIVAVMALPALSGLACALALFSGRRSGRV